MFPAAEGLLWWWPQRDKVSDFRLAFGVEHGYCWNMLACPCSIVMVKTLGGVAVGSLPMMHHVLVDFSDHVALALSSKGLQVVILNLGS